MDDSGNGKVSYKEFTTELTEDRRLGCLLQKAVLGKEFNVL